MESLSIRRLRLRYAAACASCGIQIEAGSYAFWNATDKNAVCTACAEPERAWGEAGSSAQEVADRRKANRERKITDAHPRIGKIILALSDEPQSTKAWAVGAVGERKLGGGLDRLRSATTVVLHDRRIPGSKANIDHIVIAPSGVWVIDGIR